MFTLCRLLLIFTVVTAAYCLVLFGSTAGPGGLFLVLLIVAALRAKRRRTLSAFGTARLAGEDELRRAGMIDGGPGLIVGRLVEVRRPPLLPGVAGLFDLRKSSAAASERLLRSLLPNSKVKAPIVKLATANHTSVYAPSGKGKGASIVLPFLFDCPEPCVTVDFGGGIARLTAKYRRRTFRHQQALLDPWKLVTNHPDQHNPIASIKKSDSDGIDACRDLAEALVVRTGHEPEPHWGDASEIFIGTGVAGVVYYADQDDRSLQTVRDVLTNPQKLEAFTKLLCSSDAWGGMLARMGYQLTHFKDRELGSTMTSTNRHMRWLDTLAVAESTKASTFDPAELRTGKLDVYLILPLEHARTQSPLLRMWLCSMLRAIVRGGLQQ